jgi:hydrogenase expression/formation protein HypC
MCVAVPARVTGVDADGTATVLAQGREVAVTLLAMPDEPVRPGDWLLVHSGIALARIDEHEAVARQQLITRTGEQG